MKKTTYLMVATVIAAIAASAATRSPKKEISNNLSIFNAIVKELQTNYVDSIDATKSITTAINAMLEDIDPYTEYIPYEEQADFRSITTGEYGGIGSYIQERSGKVYFSEPTAGSPSQVAGIRAGDLILKIDDDTVDGWKSQQVSERLKGTAGTRVKVMVKRPYVEDSILTFDLRREKIYMPSVTFSGKIGPGGTTGYIGLSSFTEKSPQEVKDALLALKADPAVKGIVLDLRGNGGGLLESAVKIVNLFVPKGTEVVRTRGNDAMSEKIYKTTGQPVDATIPLAVLIDGGSASASEIVAGALQDLDRAVIIGNRSFGKGLVQTTRQLPFDGLLKVTIAKYYIPSGRLIQAIDYSHRNADGSVSRIPDSLTHVFSTAGGREVRDGAGITPDITIDYPEPNRLAYNIVRDNWAFDYATRFASRQASIAPPAEFEVTDSIYEDFKAFIDPARLNYDKVCEGILTRLREAAKVEGYMNDSVDAQLTVLENMLKHDLYQDLDISRKLIAPYLASEIVTRYYHGRGAAENALRYDNAVDTVSAVLTDAGRYHAILHPAKSKKQK